MSTEERKFLHDLSNPLAVGYGNMRIIGKKLDTIENASEVAGLKIGERVQKALESFEKVSAMLKERKKYLESL